MFERLKKELRELNSTESHMEEEPILSRDNNSLLLQLVDLSKRTSSNFTVYGKAENFTLKTPASNGATIIFFLFLSFFPTMFFINHIIGFLSLLAFILLALIVVVLLIKFLGKTCHNIEIDSILKLVTIKNNNIIGRYLEEQKIVDFTAVKEISSKIIGISGAGGVPRKEYNRIVLKTTDGNVLPLIDLNAGPYIYINHKIFMGCIMQIINNGTFAPNV
ncbi:MAG: hypothetical protein K0Q79_1900 [Flavipsychrobacter sp.]|jgi:hypothetical protein|nr:hypothetical protein [Flavipsychrobacter sp.]